MWNTVNVWTIRSLIIYMVCFLMIFDAKIFSFFVNNIERVRLQDCSKAVYLSKLCIINLTVSKHRNEKVLKNYNYNYN